jgi:hypothetical protein
LQAPGAGSSSFTVSRAPHETGIADAELLGGDDVVAGGEEKDLHSFEIDPAQVFFSLDLTLCYYVEGQWKSKWTNSSEINS